MQVIVADDHAIFREGLLRLLHEEQDVQVLSHHADGPEALEALLRDQPELAILDISMPGLDGFAVTRRLTEVGSPTKVIILSMHTSAVAVDHAFRSGAHAYVVKDDAFEALTLAIDAVRRGERYVSPSAVHMVQERALTDRELEVLDLIAIGCTTSQVAEELGIHPKTVEAHRRKLMEKLDAVNVADLIRRAGESGLLRSPQA